ncbi:hypothetical protein P2H44_07975 [Albimonas sp. CAU 1670]|uniref:hypothetical protein n=1 Tax=Albimonas sp. CAU 1670 TaxID=3032599 RepID=UPI0023DA25CA|nr:hypothetical protein [Albimonas sp. CAU 1670]MDF2232487.1 hypothetical protein [Albimonas sp. CAU 1670]
MGVPDMIRLRRDHRETTSDRGRAPRRRAATGRGALAVAGLAGLLALGACASPAPEAEVDVSDGVSIAETTRMRAEILSVDPSGGQIMMRDLATGETFVHRPPAEMTGAIGVKPGDVVEAMRTRAITAWPAEPGDDTGGTQTELMSTPAASGGSPAMVGGKLTRSVMTFVVWNDKTDVAVFRSPEGNVVRYHLTNDEARAFVASLDEGDPIEVEISDTVVVKLVE